jgi:hypothetical protein
MRVTIFYCILTAIQVQPHLADGCTRDTIKSFNQSSGELLTTSGEKFQALGQDFIVPVEWRPNEQLSVCDDTRQAPPADNIGLYQIVNLTRGEILTFMGRGNRTKNR